MEPIHESIFSSTIRSFCKTFASVIGLSLALIPLFFFLGSLTSEYETAPKADVKFLPDLKGNTQMQPPSSPVVLRINIHGPIGRGGNGVSAEDVEMILTESRKGLFAKNRVKAILLHMQTPGGAVIDSDNIYRYLQEYKKKYSVPVFAYVDGLCASGGMYIGCAANRINASPVSVVGSIGVIIGPYFNFSDTLQSFGVLSKTFTNGTDKDELNSFRPWKQNEGASLKAIGDFYYERFVDLITQNRPNLDRTKLLQEYGAHIFDAPKAVELGYIDDANSSYEQTLQELMVAAKINEKKPYQVVEITTKKPWVHHLFSHESRLWQNVQSMFLPRQNNPFSYTYEVKSSFK